MSKFKGFKLRGQRRTEWHSHTPQVPVLKAAGGFPAAHVDVDAQARVMQKVTDLGAEFFSMPAEQYGEWVDALPRDEFIEYVALATH